jgi:Uma2 family endonuclease
VTIPRSRRLPPTPYTPPLVSWEDYLPWALANEFPSEWVDGEIIEIMPSSVRHQRILQFLMVLMVRLVQRERLGEVLSDVLMRLQHRQSGRVPDLMFISNDKMSQLTDTHLDGPADLVVEIVSPDSEIRDRRDKLAEYEAAGVREFWLIDEPRQEARFYVLDGNRQYSEAYPDGEGIYVSAVLPDLRLRVDWLWRDPLPTVNEALADLPS